MDTKLIYRILIFSAVVITLIAQAAPKTKQQLMDESLEEKILNYTTTIKRKCAKDVQERAHEIVDSLLLQVANSNTIDTFERPTKPTKPNRPKIRAAKDTLPIKPLFDQ